MLALRPRSRQSQPLAGLGGGNPHTSLLLAPLVTSAPPSPPGGTDPVGPPHLPTPTAEPTTGSGSAWNTPLPPAVDTGGQPTSQDHLRRSPRLRSEPADPRPSCWTRYRPPRLTTVHPCAVTGIFRVSLPGLGAAGATAKFGPTRWEVKRGHWWPSAPPPAAPRPQSYLRHPQLGGWRTDCDPDPTLVSTSTHPHHHLAL